MGLEFMLSVLEMLSWDQQRPLSGTVGSFPNKLRKQEREKIASAECLPDSPNLTGLLPGGSDLT